MTKYLVALRYHDGLTVNIHAKFVHENPTEDELDKVIEGGLVRTNSIYDRPTIIFMQKLYSEDKQ